MSDGLDLVRRSSRVSPVEVQRRPNTTWCMHLTLKLFYERALFDIVASVKGVDVQSNYVVRPGSLPGVPLREGAGPLRAIRRFFLWRSVPPTNTGYKVG